MKVIRICVICGREKESFRRGQKGILHVERGVCEDCKTVRVAMHTPKKRYHPTDHIGMPR